MANVKLTFCGNQLRKNDAEILCFAKTDGEIVIKISNHIDFQFISLDKSTAIKLSKELRKQIALI